jgi:EmrB/QacA subfamily drug resistance transporter
VSAGKLRAVKGSDIGLVVEPSRPTVMGRDESADVVISDDEVSRRHVVVSAEGSELVVQDVGSTNGTFVNDERITGPRTLQPGDRLRIGETVFEFVPPAPPERERLLPDAGPGELRIVGGPGAGTRVPISAPTTLGRHPGCDVVLSDEEVSRYHVAAIPEEDHVVIADLGSLNGTYVNGERLIDRRRLQGGERIEVGAVTLEYVSARPAATKAQAIPAPQQVTTLRQVVAQPSVVLTAEGASRKWWTLAVVCGAVFMLLVDTTIVSVALPAISQDLDASFSELQWVIDAYALVLAALLLTSGSLSDVLGRRHVFALGLVLFTVFSAVCGLAWSPVVLDVARGAQAIGAAMMFATSLALLAQEFPPAERGTAFGAWGATTALAVAIGPLVGGALTEWLGWEAIFYVNVPLGLLALYLTLTKLANLPGPQSSIDLLGLTTFSAGIFALVLAVIRGNDAGWSSPLILGLLTGAAVSLIAFVAIETRRSEPMLDLSLFRKPTFGGASVVGFMMSASVLSLIIYIVLWLQSILAYSPLDAGLRMLALTALAVVVSPLVGRVGGRLPPQLLLGAGMATLGAAILLMTGIDGESSWTALLPGLLLAGAGMGLTTSPLASTAVGVVPPWQAGMASGINSTFRQLGLAIGVVVLGAFFQHQVSTHLESALAGTPLAGASAEYAEAVAAGSTPQLVAYAPPTVRQTLRDAAAESFATGLKDIFVIAAILAFVGALAGLLLVRKHDLWAPPRGSPPAASMAAAG